VCAKYISLVLSIQLVLVKFYADMHNLECTSYLLKKNWNKTEE